MFRTDVDDAAPIVKRTLLLLLSSVPTRGRQGADLRRQIGDVISHCETLLQNDVIGLPLDTCFDLARKSGASLLALKNVRLTTEKETPRTQGGILLKQSLIHFCLATEGRVISTMKFVSRQDVDRIRMDMHAAFGPAEDIAADEMEALTYRALISLHAAVMFHLIETGRPLPRMVAFQFYQPLPTLVTSYKLYDTAGRADELRDENKVVHPAFMPPVGRAMSA